MKLECGAVNTAFSEIILRNSLFHIAIKVDISKHGGIENAENLVNSLVVAFSLNARKKVDNYIFIGVVKVPFGHNTAKFQADGSALVIRKYARGTPAENVARAARRFFPEKIDSEDESDY